MKTIKAGGPDSFLCYNLQFVRGYHVVEDRSVLADEKWFYSILRSCSPFVDPKISKLSMLKELSITSSMHMVANRRMRWCLQAISRSYWLPQMFWDPLYKFSGGWPNIRCVARRTTELINDRGFHFFRESVFIVEQRPYGSLIHLHKLEGDVGVETR